MRTNTVKRELLRGEPSIGAETGLGSVLSAEMLSRVGFESAGELDPLIEAAHVLGILTAQSNSKAPKTRPPFDCGA